MKRVLFCAGVLLFAVSAASAAELTGTLKKIKDSGSMTIGYRNDAPPFSSEDEAGAPVGYAVELCQRIATAVKEHLGLAELKIQYKALTAGERLDAVSSGQVDIECGNTTVTLGRRQTVDFTLMTFVTGGSLLGKRSSNIRSTGDLNGKTVGVIKGTTTADALNAHLAKSFIDATVRDIDDRVEGMRLLDSGEIDALASDRIVLIGQILNSEDRNLYAISNDLFSYEPYAMIVRRNDPDFRLVADRALSQIFKTDQIVSLYEKWFGKAGVRPTPILLAMYRFQALPE